MSWDVSIMRFDRSYDRIEDMPKEARPLPLGPRKSVQEAVLRVFPGTDWRDPAWGRWESAFGSIEFNLGADEPADSMMLHVRAGPEVGAAIVSLCLDNGWQGIDCSMGDFLEKRADATAGIKAWRAYRDRVIEGAADRDGA